nr:AAA family ATPase [Roseomonas rosulenta]
MTAGEPPRQEYLVSPTIPLGKPGVIFGAGGIGKSLVGLALCLSVAIRGRFGETALGGFSILGGYVPLEAAGASVFLTLEDDTAEVHRRIASLDPENRRRDAPCYVIPAVDLPNFDPALVMPDGRAAVLTELAKHGLDRLLKSIAAITGRPVRVLILDPAGDFLNGDENDATFVKMLMRQLRAVAARHGCTIILVGHVAKGMDADNLTMRGSGAWIANSRFAYALWKPMPDEARRLAQEVDEPAETLVWGNLVKANHAGAPIGMHRLFARSASGDLLDVTNRLASHGPTEEQLLTQLAKACAECAAAGLPFTITGNAGLYNGRADLPEPLASMSKHGLEGLGNKALDQQMLVKARTAATQASPKFLDVPNGPLATGVEVPLFQGSRREALERFRAARGL